MAKSPLYWHPLIYKTGLWLLHGRHLKKRYKYISKEIGKNKTVLEPGCGPGLIARHLDKTCKYTGFDIDPVFVKYAKKKGLNVYKGDAIKKKSYKKADVILICDFLHHIGRKDEKKVLKLCKQNAKKIIICEQPAPILMQKLPLYITFHNYLDKDIKGKANIALQRTDSENQ